MFPDSVAIDATTIARLAAFCARHGALNFTCGDSDFAICVASSDAPYLSTTCVKITTGAGAPVLDVERQVIDFAQRRELVHTYRPGVWLGALVTLACNVQAASGRPWETEVSDEWQ
jgi:hypothetical protein